MKTIGLLGGMSWESTAVYYRLINRAVSERLGGHHSAKIALFSVDFAEVQELQAAGDWNEAGRLLGDAAERLDRAGADFVVLCTNTMHKVAPQIEAQAGIPLLHITQPTGEAIKAQNLECVGLLGTRYTMEQDFYRRPMETAFGLNILIPDEEDRVAVHRVLFDELCMGKVLDESRRRFVEVVDRLAERGAQGVILGCTEIAMLLKPEDVSTTLFDTTAIHARAAVDRALRYREG